MKLEDLRHVLHEVVTPALHAAQEGRPGTRLRMAKLNQAAAELLAEGALDFEGRAFLKELLEHTGENAELHAVRENHLERFSALLKKRIADLEAAESAASKTPPAAPIAPEAIEKSGAPAPNAAVHPERNLRWLVALGGALALGVLAIVMRQFDSECPDGFYLRDGVCVSPPDPVERYAACVIKDEKSSTVTDKGTLVQLNHAKNAAGNALDVKNRFEQSVERSKDRCVILDVSARCFALATGETEAPALPASCKDEAGKTPGAASAPPAMAGTADAEAPRKTRRCDVSLDSFSLGKPTCAGRVASRAPTGDEKTQLEAAHSGCDNFMLFYCAD